MNKEDAIRMMLAGEKVRHSDWEDHLYIFYHAGNFIDENDGYFSVNELVPCDLYEIYKHKPNKKCKLYAYFSSEGYLYQGKNLKDTTGLIRAPEFDVEAE
jgi:hypothetical protein